MDIGIGTLTRAITTILLLFYFYLCLCSCFCRLQSATVNAGHSTPTPTNVPPHRQQFNIYAAGQEEAEAADIDNHDDDDDATLVFVFALTFDPLKDKLEMWDRRQTANIISSVVDTWYMRWNYSSSDRKALFVFRNALQQLEFVWLAQNETLDKCKEVFDNNNKGLWPEDMQTESYEPVRNVGTVHLETVLKQLTSSTAEDSGNNVSASATTHHHQLFRIVLVTNYAEKALVSFLFGSVPEQYRHRVVQIALEAVTIRSANYYFYALSEPDNVLFVDGMPYSKALDENRNSWQLIYLFVLSSRLNKTQLLNVISAAKTPLEAYFAKSADGEAEQQQLGLGVIIPCYDVFWEKYSIRIFNNVYNLDILFADIMDIQCSVYVPTAKYEKENFTSILLGFSIDALERSIFGAPLSLRDGRGADAVRPMPLAKPRIYLVTDYVDKTFLTENLPDRHMFEFHVYSLNQLVKEQYENTRGAADLVVLLDPDNPKPIRIDEADDEEDTTTTTPSHWPVNPPDKALNFPFFIIPTAIGLLVLVLSALIAAVIIYRRMANRLCWLHRLEQFKTEHIFAAYQEQIQSSGKNSGKRDTDDCWEMRWDQLVMSTEQLGKGVFGEVRKATLTSPLDIECQQHQNLANFHKAAYVAVKMLHMHCAEKARRSFLQEIQFMKSLANGHRCVVHMLGCMSRPDGVLGLVLEFCPNGSLLDHVRAMSRELELEQQKQQANEEEKKTNNVVGQQLGEKSAIELGRQFPRFAWQICDAMLYLSEKGLVHRDLAARNVLLDAHMVARLSDFGLCLRTNPTDDEKSSLLLSNSMTNEAGGIEGVLIADREPDKLPIRWLAPECLERRQFSVKSDVWSFGVLLFELYSLGNNPFDGVEHRELLSHIRATSPPCRPTLCSDSIYQLMRTCFTLDPGQRADFGQLQAELTAMLEEETGRYGYLVLE